VKNKIAFFLISSVPPVTRSVTELLVNSFPEYEITKFEIKNLILKHPIILLINMLHVINLYGRDLIRGKRRIRFCFWRTAYIFRNIKTIAGKLLARGDYLFSFQLTSVFDASYAGIPHFVYTDHTHLQNLNYPDFDPNMLYAPEWIELEKTIYQNANKILLRSSNIALSLNEQYGCPEEKAGIVYAGVNVHSNSKGQSNAGYNKKNILFVGVDWIRKGGDDLVSAFEIVLQKHPDASLTIVGCSPDIDLPNCTIVGKIPAGEVGHYYEQASVFCLPTKVEPFGVVFIEALSFYLPIVATNVGAIPDFIVDGENGYLVEPGDVQALAEVLIDLIGDRERCRAFGNSGYSLYQERYNWDAVGKLIRENILPLQ